MDETSGEVMVGNERQRRLDTARNTLFGLTWEGRVPYNEVSKSNVEILDEAQLRNAVRSVIEARVDVLKAEKASWQQNLGQSRETVGPDGQKVKKPDGYELGAQITDCERALETVAGSGGHIDSLVKVVESEAAIAYEKANAEYKRQESLAPRRWVGGLIGPRDGISMGSINNMHNQEKSHIASVVDAVKKGSPSWTKS